MESSNNSDLKHIILSQGYIASGKSTISKQIADRLPAIRLETKDIPIKVVDKESKDFRYRLLVNMTMDALKDGRDTIVLDGTFGDKKYRDMVYRLAIHYGAEVIIVRCICDDKNETFKRIEKRGDPKWKDSHCLQEYLKQQHDKFTWEEGVEDPLGYYPFNDLDLSIITIDTKTNKAVLIDPLDPDMGVDWENSGMVYEGDEEDAVLACDTIVFTLMKLLNNIMKENNK